MIGDQTKILPRPGMLNGTAPWEVCVAPVGIVTQDQLLRRLCNRIFTWKPGQIRQHQLPPRCQPRFDQGNHPLRIEVQPTLSTTDDIEGLGGEYCIFSSTGHKADIEVFLSSELLGSNNLCFRNIDTGDKSPLSCEGSG